MTAGTLGPRTDAEPVTPPRGCAYGYARSPLLGALSEPVSLFHHAQELPFQVQPYGRDDSSPQARTSPNEWGFLSGGTANLSRRIEAPDESRYPDLIAFDFSKGVLSLCALGKLMCGVPQVGKHCDDLLYLVYLRYFHNGLDQRSFLPNCPLSLMNSACCFCSDVADPIAYEVARTRATTPQGLNSGKPGCGADQKGSKSDVKILTRIQGVRTKRSMATSLC